MPDGRLKIGSDFLKIGSRYLRIGPSPASPGDILLLDQGRGTGNHPGFFDQELTLTYDIADYGGNVNLLLVTSDQDTANDMALTDPSGLIGGWTEITDQGNTTDDIHLRVFAGTSASNLSGESFTISVTVVDDAVYAQLFLIPGSLTGTPEFAVGFDAANSMALVVDYGGAVPVGASNALLVIAAIFGADDDWAADVGTFIDEASSGGLGQFIRSYKVLSPTVPPEVVNWTAADVSRPVGLTLYIT